MTNLYQNLISTTLTVVVLLLPLIIMLYQSKNQHQHKLLKIRCIINHSLLTQIEIGLLLYILLLLFDKFALGNLNQSLGLEMFSKITITYIAIGVKFYVPAVIIFNLTVGLINFIRKNTTN